MGVLLKFSAGEYHVPQKPAMCFTSVHASCYVCLSVMVFSCCTGQYVFDVKKQQKAYTNIGAFLLHAIRLPRIELSGSSTGEILKL